MAHKKSFFKQASTAQNTWYTALDVSSGNGVCHFISLAFIILNLNGNEIEIKVTVDGTAYTLAPTTTINYALGLTKKITTANGGYNSWNIKQDIYFTSSFKVEVRKTSTDTGDVSMCIDYELN